MPLNLKLKKIIINQIVYLLVMFKSCIEWVINPFNPPPPSPPINLRGTLTFRSYPIFWTKVRKKTKEKLPLWLGELCAQKITLKGTPIFYENERNICIYFSIVIRAYSLKEFNKTGKPIHSLIPIKNLNGVKIDVFVNTHTHKKHNMTKTISIQKWRSKKLSAF